MKSFNLNIKKLKYYMWKNHFSGYSELAKSMGVSRQWISKLINKRWITEQSLEKIAKILKVKPTTLIYSTIKKETEADIQKKIMKELKGVLPFYTKYIATGANDSGVSDIIGCTKDGRFVAIEVKKPGRNPTKLQKRFLDTIKNAGGVSMVARSTEDILPLKINQDSINTAHTDD